jgi:hypothetical protein
VAQLSRVPVHGDAAVYGAERAPSVFSRETLGLALTTIAKLLGRPPNIDEIREVFSLALTDLVVGDLLPLEHMYTATRPLPDAADQRLLAAAPLDGLETWLVHETVEAVIAPLEPEDQTLLLHKMAGEADNEIARRLGVSRPTVIKRKRVVFEVLTRALQGLSEPAQREVVDGVYSRLLEAL